MRTTLFHAQHLLLHAPPRFLALKKLMEKATKHLDPHTHQMMLSFSNHPQAAQDFLTELEKIGIKKNRDGMNILLWPQEVNLILGAGAHENWAAPYLKAQPAPMP